MDGGGPSCDCSYQGRDSVRIRMLLGRRKRTQAAKSSKGASEISRVREIS